MPKAVEIEIEREVNFTLVFAADVTPGRPAPQYYRDHDDPRFSDAGDPTEVSNIHLVLGPSKVKDLERVLVSAGVPKEVVAKIDVGQVALGTLEQMTDDFVAPNEGAFAEECESEIEEGPDPDEEWERRMDR